MNFTRLLDKSTAKLVLIDSTSFRLFGIDTTMKWRDEEIIPRYNSHGVKKLAFHLPQRSAPIGKHPAPEGPAEFPTGYFATRNEATEWLIS